MLSAFCKSLRGGDSNAALAWFARLIYAGLDPRIICRRIIAHASEDVGMANPTAMQQAVAAAQSLELIGMPEARLSIAQAIVFVCESPKSNSIVLAVDGAFAEAEKTIDEPVPIHLRDTSYKGAKQLGHGAGYKYPHDYPNHEVEQNTCRLQLKDMFTMFRQIWALNRESGRRMSEKAEFRLKNTKNNILTHSPRFIFDECGGCVIIYVQWFGQTRIERIVCR